jgi:hypothetical protein
MEMNLDVSGCSLTLGSDVQRDRERRRRGGRGRKRKE